MFSVSGRERYRLDAALSQGIWAVVAIFLLLYVVKENEKRDLRQEEREKNYQLIIKQLTEQFSILNEVKENVAEMKNYIVEQRKCEENVVAKDRTG